MEYHLGLDLGGTNIVAGVVDQNYDILAKESVPSNGSRPIEEITLDMATVAKKVVAQAGLAMSDFRSWGIGMPSCINPKTGMLVHANCFGWKNVPVHQYLERHIDLPIYIENDANCAAYGEALAGAAKNFSNAIMLTLGTGLGGGIIIDKKIFPGCDMMGAELGHTKLVYDGVLCTCGQKGCLESYASATALINQTLEGIKKFPDSLMAKLCENDPAKVDGVLAFNAAKQGDRAAHDIVDRYIDYLSAGISTFIAIFRPDIIIIGGGISNEGPNLLDPLNDKIMENTFSAEVIGVPKAIPAELGNDAGLIGAAFLENNFIDRNAGAWRK